MRRCKRSLLLLVLRRDCRHGGDSRLKVPGLGGDEAGVLLLGLPREASILLLERSLAEAGGLRSKLARLLLLRLLRRL